jgi:hypothetical protein
MLVEGLVSLRSGGFGLDNEAMFIGSWLVVGVLVLLMAGPSYPAGALFVIPPFAIAVSLYMDRCLRASHPSPYFQIGVDLGIVLALVLAVALADGFFYKLPDVYPSALWSLPGTPVTITAGEDPAIPLWKLWFLPGPFLLLFGAVLIFLFTVFQRLQALPFVVSGVSLLMLFFANTVLMPIFYPPLAEYLSTRLQSHLKTTRYATQQESPKFYLLARSDQMASLIYYLNQNPEQPLRLMRSRRALQTAIQQAGPEEPIVGILNERDYYQLPDALREQLEVVAAQQIWDLQRTAIIKTWMSEVDASQNYVLLVKQVPAHLKEAQDAVSEDTPAETW